VKSQLLTQRFTDANASLEEGVWKVKVVVKMNSGNSDNLPTAPKVG
jgi:hypothetical protein